MALTTRERILRATVSVMREHGLVGATTRAIAESAGVAEGSIYRNFADKAELLKLAVMDYLLPEFLEVIRSLPARAGTQTVRLHLKFVVAKALSFYHNVVPMWGGILADNQLRSDFMETTRRGEIGPHLAIRALAGYISLEQKKQRIPAAIDALAAAQMLLGGAVQQAIFAQLVGADRLPHTDELLIDRMVNSLLRKG